VLERPYAERQLIVIVPDRIARAQQAALDHAPGSKIDWESVLGKTVKVLAFLSPGVAVGLAVASKAEKVRSEGVEVLSVGRSAAAERIRFPLGHPRDRIVYVGHPAIPPLYYSVAQFHRFTFEHKFAEAIHLLRALGATSLRVESVKGWSREMAAAIKAPIPGQPVDVGLKGSHSQGASASALFEATLKGSEDAVVPDGLVWYWHEPTWQEIAEGRIHSGLTEFSMAVSYEDDFGVNIGLKAKIDKYGLEVGGDFQNHQSTLWSISGTFKH
jgi:hypothetical protein